MFTGLIDDVGVITRTRTSEAGRELRVDCRYEDLAAGESIALNGACLTVRESGARWFTVAAIETTLDRTRIGDWEVGSRVNLERALVAGARLGGHLVQGHVDAVAQVVAVRRQGDTVLVDVGIPSSLANLAVLHGSIAVDGVSLTVNALPDSGVVQLALIEYTLSHTTLGQLRVGDRVQIETDVIGKYVRQLVAPYRHGGADPLVASDERRLEHPVGRPTHHT